MFKVIEAFSGIGSQAKALEKIGIEYEIVNTVEWDMNAIIAYNLIHNKCIDTSIIEDMSDDEIYYELKKYTLSGDSKTEIKEKALIKYTAEFKRKLLASIIQTKNLVSITDVKGKDISENVDLLTYSFPCQDLSLCSFWHGNDSGIKKNVNNRSGMLWEIERILNEMNQENKILPRFLLMENVKSIVTRAHIKDFMLWTNELERLGYYNKIYILNSKNFGIPQKRERAYMISIFTDGDNLLKKRLDEYFYCNNLENFYDQNRIEVSDILRLNYENKFYKEEADENNPNDTKSRREIKNKNDILFDGKTIKNININTITTKQDRNPNSGIIIYNSAKDGKAEYRNLTPRECFMFMGFEECDYQILVDNNINIGNRKLFTKDVLHRFAGNSIVVNVLEEIFKQIIDIKKHILEYEKYNTEPH